MKSALKVTSWITIVWGVIGLVSLIATAQESDNTGGILLSILIVVQGVLTLMYIDKRKH